VAQVANGFATANVTGNGSGASNCPSLNTVGIVP
jgi:hypothetical protein